MSLFTKVPKPTILAPEADSARDSADSEIRVNEAFTSQIQFHNNFYNYLDKTGATFPSLDNTGLEGQYIADQAIESQHLYPQEDLITFNTADKTSVPDTVNFHSYLTFDITTTFNNAYIVIDYYRYFQSTGGGSKFVLYQLQRETAPGSGVYTDIFMNPLDILAKDAVVASSTSVDTGSGRGPVYKDTLGVAGTYNFRLNVRVNTTSSFNLITTRHTIYYRILNGQTS
jgi:hypothetical protein